MKIVALSDSHNSTHEVEVLDGDVLIHAGDFSFMGKSVELDDFIGWLNKQPHKHKLWIPGNHELSLEDFSYNMEVIDNETGATCIHNKEYEIDGIKFFGTAHTPEYGNWAFMMNEEQSKRFWEHAPEADVIVSHGPPREILDSSTPDFPKKRLGCVSFKKYLERTKPKVALWGHIHGSGRKTEVVKWDGGGETFCANVAVMDEDYAVSRPVTVIEI